MGLKELLGVLLNRDDWQIKSDQNGIERTNFTFSISYHLHIWIKSDQNGIERIKTHEGVIMNICDKIRPKWD